MKIDLIITFTILFCTTNIFSQTLEEREKQIAAQNHIKTKIQIDYNYKTGKISKSGIITSRTYYSRSGDILRKEFLNSKGHIIGKEIYEYDRNNNRTLYEREGSGSKYKKISEYDSKNNLVVESGFNGTENFRNKYNYTSAGKLHEVVYTINDGIKQKLVYRNSGNTTNIETYMGGASLTSKIKIVYDIKGNIIKETTYSIGGNELEEKEYKYNLSSQLLEETKTRKGKFYYRYAYNYDSKGNLLSLYEETLAKKNYAKKVFTYDVAGNLTEYKWRRNPDEEFNSKKYTYNSKGICLSEHTYYPDTKYELLSKYEYEFY